MIAERIREGVAASPVETTDATIRLTVSIGVAEKLPDVNAEEMVRASDQAMYSAKAMGRDRVVAFA
jgi:diguanylate cyclase (GGDEF)-like protein